MNQDALKTRRRCVRAAEEALREGRNVIIDRCNFDAEQRATWLALQPTPARVVAVELVVPVQVAQERVATREGHEGGVDGESMARDESDLVVGRVASQLTRVAACEGFDEVVRCSDEASRTAALATLLRLGGGEQVAASDEDATAGGGAGAALVGQAACMVEAVTGAARRAARMLHGAMGLLGLATLTGVAGAEGSVREGRAGEAAGWAEAPAAASAVWFALACAAAGLTWRVLAGQRRRVSGVQRGEAAGGGEAAAAAVAEQLGGGDGDEASGTGVRGAEESEDGGVPGAITDGGGGGGLPRR